MIISITFFVSTISRDAQDGWKLINFPGWEGIMPVFFIPDCPLNSDGFLGLYGNIQDDIFIRDTGNDFPTGFFLQMHQSIFLHIVKGPR
jgi:hypothetical protein